MQAAVAQFLFVGHNVHHWSTPMAREAARFNMETLAPLHPIAISDWSNVLVSAGAFLPTSSASVAQEPQTHLQPDVVSWS